MCDFNIKPQETQTHQRHHEGSRHMTLSVRSAPCENGWRRESHNWERMATVACVLSTAWIPSLAGHYASASCSLLAGSHHKSDHRCPLIHKTLQPPHLTHSTRSHTPSSSVVGEGSTMCVLAARPAAWRQVSCRGRGPRSPVAGSMFTCLMGQQREQHRSRQSSETDARVDRPKPCTDDLAP